MASLGGIWVPMTQRALRQAVTSSARAAKVLRSKVTAAVRNEHGTGQPMHLAALRRQLASGHVVLWTQVVARHVSSRLLAVPRRFASTRASLPFASPVHRPAYLQSRVGTRAVWRSSGRAPFAMTLRPNLTGGALPRTAGGYGSFGSARHFSHTPAAPAQVMQHVSQAMRAFLVGGHRARFDGVDAHGRACYRAIGALEADVAARTKGFPVAMAPLHMPSGAYVDFSLSPTITALATSSVAKTPALAAAAMTTLHTEGFLDVLSVDFARALHELGAVMNDLRRLAALGDLPIDLVDGAGLDRPGLSSTTLRVHFPGVDADTVDRLCADLGITRGVVGEDDLLDVGPPALRFPFVPEDADTDNESPQHLLTSPGGSLRSHDSSACSRLGTGSPFEDMTAAYDDGDDHSLTLDNNPWLSIDVSSRRSDVRAPSRCAGGASANLCPQSTDDFEGLEGIYRFLGECDRREVRF